MHRRLNNLVSAITFWSSHVIKFQCYIGELQKLYPKPHILYSPGSVHISITQLYPRNNDLFHEQTLRTLFCHRHDPTTSKQQASSQPVQLFSSSSAHSGSPAETERGCVNPRHIVWLVNGGFFSSESTLISFDAGCRAFCRTIRFTRIEIHTRPTADRWRCECGRRDGRITFVPDACQRLLLLPPPRMAARFSAYDERTHKRRRYEEIQWRWASSGCRYHRHRLSPWILLLNLAIIRQRKVCRRNVQVHWTDWVTVFSGVKVF